MTIALQTDRLTRYFDDYLAIARDLGTGFVLESATWRASRDWATRIGTPLTALPELNRRGIEMLVALRERYAGEVGPISPSLYSQMMPGVMRDFGAADIETQVIALPAGDAVLAEFSTPSLGSEGLQYSIFSDVGLWVLTLTADDADEYRSLVAHMADSFATG